MKLKILLALLLSLTNVKEFFAQAYEYLSDAERKESISLHLALESDNTDSLIVYRGYVIKFDKEHYIPLISFNYLTFEQINHDGHTKAKRRSGFFPEDKYLEIYSPTNWDYKGSGYDRGHMVPAGDFYWDKKLKDETFSYANIAPQTANLNRGIWAGLENQIRMIVLRDSSDAYIINGTITTEFEKIKDRNVTIPDYFYKLVYFPNENLMFGFMFYNCFCSYDTDITSYQVPIDFIEKIVNIDFFDKLDDKVENQLEMRIPNFNEQFIK